MSDLTIKIRNCNNITNGEIAICANKLNILFGRNGTGKSTIARAIYLTFKGKPTSSLHRMEQAARNTISNRRNSLEHWFDDEYVPPICLSARHISRTHLRSDSPKEM